MSTDLSKHKVEYSPTSGASQLAYQLAHYHKQFKESSKYEDGVIDYNGQPLSDQLHKQAQPAPVPLPRKPSVADEERENFVVESIRYRNYARNLNRSLTVRNNVLAFFLVALVLFMIFLILRGARIRL